MPSPIAHITVGCVIYELARTRSGLARLSASGQLVGLAVALFFSLMPDLDSVAGILSGDFGRYHNNLTHSLFMGLSITPVAAIVAYVADRQRTVQWVLLALVCYELHVLMDFFTVGRGVMIFWPLSPQRWEPPIKIFYGLHWSDGWFSHKHLWTLLNETTFAACLVGVAMWMRRRGKDAPFVVRSK